MTVPLLSVRDARIETSGVVLAEVLSFECTGAAVALVGDFAPVFGLFTGDTTLVRGAVDVLGVPATVALAQNHVGIALGDPPLPKNWTVVEYLAAAGRLLGLSGREATEHAILALDGLELTTLRNRLVATLGVTERRSVAFARATLGGPPVLALENPLRGAGDAGAAILAALVARALSGRKLVIGMQSPPTVGPIPELLSKMDDVVVLASGAVVAHGPPGKLLSGGSYCYVSATRATSALATLLRERGAVVKSTSPLDPEHDAGRLLVTLPEGAPANLIIDAALAVDAPVIELVPAGFDWPARTSPTLSP